MLDEFLGVRGRGEGGVPLGRPWTERLGSKVNLCPHGEIYF